MTPIPSPYQPADTTKLEWRIYQPLPAVSSPTPGPAVLVVHGGSWDQGHPFQPVVEKVAEYIAESGFWVFSGDYRLAPCGKIFGQHGHDSSQDGFNSGRPPQQTDDVMRLVLAAKADTARCNGKLGIVAVSSGGFISSFVTEDRETITGQSGRPNWTASDRPLCVVTFSSPFDLSDQSSNDYKDYLQYIAGVHNYVGNEDRDDARAASPISRIDSGTAADFRPMFMVQAKADLVCPERQVFDMVCALDTYNVDPCQYFVRYLTDSGEHGFNLWNDQDPTWVTEHTIGQSVLTFLHDNLD
jgi:acetyl esterase/lipase